MSTTMKVSLLALVSSVAAIPNYGHGHSKFHSSKAQGTGAVKPYPTGGWAGYNSTRVPHATGTGAYDTTIDITKTSTKTIVSTVIVKPSPAAPASNNAVVENISQPANGQCGPATVTVTASEKITITVTPGGGAGAPSSAAVVMSQGYGASKPEDTTTSTVYATTKVEQTSTTKAAAPSSPVAVQSSMPAQGYPVSSVNKPVASSAAVYSSAAASPTPSTGNKYSGTKRGLAYNDASLCKSFGSKFGFGYNWGQVENNDIGTQFIPMMHGPDKATSQEWLANVDKAVQKGAKAVMGFNEPDHAEQANLTPEAACSAWKEYMNPIAAKYPQVTIIGPSVTNGPPSSGMGSAWLSKFYSVCPDAIVHASNMHFYDIYDKSTITRFQAQFETISALGGGKPTWVTEYGLNPGSASQDQAASFLKDTMSYLDSNAKCQGYSWFMVGSGENQLNSGSGLSTVGQVYAAGL